MNDNNSIRSVIGHLYHPTILKNILDTTEYAIFMELYHQEEKTTNSKESLDTIYHILTHVLKYPVFSDSSYQSILEAVQHLHETPFASLHQGYDINTKESTQAIIDQANKSVQKIALYIQDIQDLYKLISTRYHENTRDEIVHYSYQLVHAYMILYKKYLNTLLTTDQYQHIDSLYQALIQTIDAMKSSDTDISYLFSTPKGQEVIIQLIDYKTLPYSLTTTTQLQGLYAIIYYSIILQIINIFWGYTEKCTEYLKDEEQSLIETITLREDALDRIEAVIKNHKEWINNHKLHQHTLSTADISYITSYKKDVDNMLDNIEQLAHQYQSKEFSFLNTIYRIIYHSNDKPSPDHKL